MKPGPIDMSARNFAKRSCSCIQNNVNSLVLIFQCYILYRDLVGRQFSFSQTPCPRILMRKLLIKINVLLKLKLTKNFFGS